MRSPRDLRAHPGLEGASGRYTKMIFFLKITKKKKPNKE
jgi:hypothetical protein